MHDARTTRRLDAIVSGAVVHNGCEQDGLNSRNSFDPDGIVVLHRVGLFVGV